MERGDIWHVDLNPVKGREQANPRYVLVLTPKSFNQLGAPIVAPITVGGEFARYQGFTVPLSGTGTNAVGVVLCHQIRALDIRARGGKFSEKAPDFIVDDVLARVSTFFE
ncbi:type II toxin-antitoxin system PemK/MazF family toxin [Rhizobium sp. TRM95796]|uniref:type II toxin-antitoxin system PemK/MazF family toxin n=1 Tax=Rhizobium sp. TRM95796 TaxID=2979862 RepID=UPI0021E99C1C|nr:type II toxin-antitoxin system PemK/MazF family toxin [Rhizobium sp. TRM95796]MCV3765890.1 type II toxin-antitoxin system PemK/MazF family toxin [Rhizobium sp. TRM95796]